MAFDTRPAPISEAQLRSAGETDYMSASQLAFFRERLLERREELVTRSQHMREELIANTGEIDIHDRATVEEQVFLQCSLRDRELEQIREIDAALRRIAAGEFGWCERTGEPIGIERLLAHPAARRVVRKAA